MAFRFSTWNFFWPTWNYKFYFPGWKGQAYRRLAWYPARHHGHAHLLRLFTSQVQASVKYGVRSQKFIWAPCHVMCTDVLISWDPETPLPPRPHLGQYTRGAIGQLRLTTSPCNTLDRSKEIPRDHRIGLLSTSHFKGMAGLCKFTVRPQCTERKLDPLSYIWTITHFHTQ